MNSGSEKRARTDVIEEGRRRVGCPEQERSKQAEVTWNRIRHGSQERNLKTEEARCPRGQVSFSGQCVFSACEIQTGAAAVENPFSCGGLMVGEPVLGSFNLQ